MTEDKIISDPSETKEMSDELSSDVIQKDIPSSKVSTRSNDAKKRRNRRRHLRLAEKQAIFYICRRISPSWTLKDVKTYLQQQKIQFAKLSPIRNNQLRIRFNNSHTLQTTNSILPEDFFSSENFSRVFSS